MTGTPSLDIPGLSRKHDDHKELDTPVLVTVQGEEQQRPQDTSWTTEVMQNGLLLVIHHGKPWTEKKGLNWWRMKNFT